MSMVLGAGALLGVVIVLLWAVVWTLFDTLAQKSPARWFVKWSQFPLYIGAGAGGGALIEWRFYGRIVYWGSEFRWSDFFIVNGMICGVFLLAILIGWFWMNRKPVRDYPRAKLDDPV